jgi:hypothetical protein
MSDAAAPAAAVADRAVAAADGAAIHEQAGTVVAAEDHGQDGTIASLPDEVVQADGGEQASTAGDVSSLGADASSTRVEQAADGVASRDTVASAAADVIKDHDVASGVAEATPNAEDAAGAPDAAILDAATAAAEQLRVEDVWDFKRKQATWHSFV